MENGEGSTSKQRVVYEYDFFDENRTSPVRTHLVPMGRESMKHQRVIYEYDFFDNNRSGPVRTHLVPIGREATPADLDVVQPVEPRFIPTDENEADSLFEKTLEGMDVSNTLFVRWSEDVMWGLTEEERRNIERAGFLEVETTDPSGNGYMMRLKKSRIFTGVAEISGEWFKLVSVNKLKEGDWVYGWGYRKDGRLCIAIKYYRP